MIVTYEAELKVHRPLLYCNDFANLVGGGSGIVLDCIVLYCIMKTYTGGRSDRYRICIPRKLSEILT